MSEKVFIISVKRSSCD